MDRTEVGGLRTVGGKQRIEVVVAAVLLAADVDELVGELEPVGDAGADFGREESFVGVAVAEIAQDADEGSVLLEAEKEGVGGFEERGGLVEGGRKDFLRVLARGERLEAPPDVHRLFEERGDAPDGVREDMALVEGLGVVDQHDGRVGDDAADAERPDGDQVVTALDVGFAVPWLAGAQAGMAGTFAVIRSVVAKRGETALAEDLGAAHAGDLGGAAVEVDDLVVAVDEEDAQGKLLGDLLDEVARGAEALAARDVPEQSLEPPEELDEEVPDFGIGEGGRIGILDDEDAPPGAVHVDAADKERSGLETLAGSVEEGAELVRGRRRGRIAGVGGGVGRVLLRGDPGGGVVGEGIAVDPAAARAEEVSESGAGAADRLQGGLQEEEVGEGVPDGVGGGLRAGRGVAAGGFDGHRV